MNRNFPQQAVRIPAGMHFLEGVLCVPAQARGMVLFAHGSGSSRHSPRNQSVARALNREGFATLLVDLLTAEEEVIDLRTRQLRFDVGLLALRLTDIIDWLTDHDELRDLSIGLFGSSTGAAAALVAASQREQWVHAVVSRGGRPDLAGSCLEEVRTPTLLIVGGADRTVLGLNEEAREAIRGPVCLEVVPDATHLFDEPGALEEVSKLAGNWFHQHLEALDVDGVSVAPGESLLGRS